MKTWRLPSMQPSVAVKSSSTFAKSDAEVELLKLAMRGEAAEA